MKKLLVIALLLPIGAHAAQYQASDLLPRSEISFSPSAGTFTEGSTFEVPVYINTEGNSINTVELHINFDPNVLSVVQPSGGVSIIGLWVEPPSYDNTQGTVKIVGAIPGGITTSAGLVTTITFAAKRAGTAPVSLSDNSRVLANDGLGSDIEVSSNRATYQITPRPPADVVVYSDTHPFQDQWSNNNNVTLYWHPDPGVSGWSYVFDTVPTTVPSVPATTTTSVTYTNVGDGVWYFHIKALHQGVWGGVTTYTVRIDTTPPAAFTPTVDYLGAAVISRFLISFNTTDALSGIDHYEVGVIDKSAPPTESPGFVRSDSPYELPFSAAKNARVVVRAYDTAGNVREESIDVAVPFLPIEYLQAHAVPILLAILILIVLLFILHYLLGHRIIQRVERGIELLKDDEAKAEPIPVQPPPPPSPTP